MVTQIERGKHDYKMPVAGYHADSMTRGSRGKTSQTFLVIPAHLTVSVNHSGMSVDQDAPLYRLFVLRFP